MQVYYQCHSHSSISNWSCMIFVLHVAWNWVRARNRVLLKLVVIFRSCDILVRRLGIDQKRVMHSWLLSNMVHLYSHVRAQKNRQLKCVTPNSNYWTVLKIEHPVTCFATIAYVLTHYVQYVLLFFSTGGKFRPAQILQSYTLLLQPPVLVLS